MENYTASVREAPESYPVDLNREEYIAYHMLSARLIGPLRGRRMQMISTGVICALLAAAILYQWFAFQLLDWSMLVLTVALLGVSVFMWLYLPARLRKQAATLYEESVASGYSYYGTIEVHPTEIRKVGQEITTAIPLNATTMFLESRDMLVWINRQGRAIVLPARCMTREAAAAVRAAADRLPSTNRRFVDRLQPFGEVPEEPDAPPVVILWDKQVQYTPEEYAAIAKSRVLSLFWRRLPQMGSMSLMVALLFAMSDYSAVSGVVAFFIAMGVLTLFQLVLPYRRIPRSPQGLPERLTTVRVTLTDRGVKVKDENENMVTVPWSAVEHVYDRGDYAELLFHHQFLRLPKRELEDVEAFDRLLKTYWKNKE